jgi:predicted NUDIX family phosphoesterase
VRQHHRLRGSLSAVPASSPPEQVLIVPRDRFPLGALLNGFYPCDFDLQALMDRHAAFVDRDLAESTSTLKQIVPYIVLTHQQRVFLYRRLPRGSEPGLRGKLSIGFGGHINPIDLDGSAFGSIARCAERELDEEVRLAAPASPVAIGLINDDDDPVGARHLGVVLRADLPSPALRIRERTRIERVGRGFFGATGFAPYLADLESWSRLILAHGSQTLIAPQNARPLRRSRLPASA